MAKDSKSQKWLPKERGREKAGCMTAQPLVKASERYKKVRGFSHKSGPFAMLFTVHFWH